MTEFNLTIVKIEGLGDLTRTQCLVYSNHEIIDRISICSPIPQSIKITKSYLKVILIDLPSSLPISSVSFDLDIIERPGFHWFPLSFTKDDFVSKVPDEVGLPRILFDINPTILAPVFEITESSETNEDINSEIDYTEISNLKSKNIELMIKVMDLENEKIKVRRELERKSEEVEGEIMKKNERLVEELEKIRNKQALAAKLSGDYIRENERIKGILVEHEDEKKILIERVERYEKLYEEVKLREDSILKLLEEKDEEIMNLTRKSHSFSICPQMPININHPASTLIQVGSALLSPPSSAFQTFKSTTPELQHPRFKTLELLDQRIQASLKYLHLEGLLKLSDEFIYQLGNRKVNMTLKKDIVNVRTGPNTYKTLESFISTSCSQDLTCFLSKKKVQSPNLHRRSSTISDLENLSKSIISKTFEQKTVKNTNPSKLFSKVLSAKRKSSSPLYTIKSSRIPQA